MLGREPFETQSTQRHGDRKETLGDLKDTGRLYSVFSVTLCKKKTARTSRDRDFGNTEHTENTEEGRESRREQAEAESKQRQRASRGREQAESGLSSVIELEQIRFRWLLIQMALKPGSEW
jgi:hypothetical protein